MGTLLLSLWLAASAALAAEPAAHEQIPGRWYPDVYGRPSADGMSAAQRAELDRLDALGYLGGYEPGVQGRGGTVRWDKDRAGTGTNLYSSGSAAEALLVAMDGRVLHRWAKPFAEAFPELDLHDPHDTGAWRRVALRPSDGHLLGIYEGIGLVHLDSRSRIVWATADRAHHDARWLPDGGVLVLTRILHPTGGPGGLPLYEDCVSRLDRDGREVRRVSVLEALRRSPWASLLQRAPTDTGDVLHTNALFPLDGSRDPAGVAGPGRVLLSFRHLDALAVLDLREERIVWATTGGWVRQHDVELAPSGAVMLFDNRGGRGQTSRVLALEPWTMRPLWSWAGEPGQPLSSWVLGAQQELPNGNVLVTESTRGRALEVTRDGDVVWEYRNPARTGPDDAYIAAIFEVIRVPLEQPMPWLSPPRP